MSVTEISRGKKWYIENRERALQNKKEHYARNKDKIIQYQALYRANNKKRIAERDKLYRETHKEECYLRARARAAGVKGRVTKEEIHNWKSKICGICDTLILGKYELDHIIPLSKGGKHSTENIQLAHRYCNRSKKDRIDFKIDRTALADGLFVD